MDTNVIISGLFFGGAPGEVLKAINSQKVTAFATQNIVDEYDGIQIITAKEFCEKYLSNLARRPPLQAC